MRGYRLGRTTHTTRTSSQVPRYTYSTPAQLAAAADLKKQELARNAEQLENILRDPESYTTHHACETYRDKDGNNALMIAVIRQDIALFNKLLPIGKFGPFNFWDLEDIKNRNGQTVLDLIRALKPIDPALYQQFKQAYDAEFISGKFKNLSKDVRALAAGLFGSGAATAATVERTDTTPTATV